MDEVRPPGRSVLIRPRGCSVMKPAVTVRFVKSVNVAGLKKFAEAS